MQNWKEYIEWRFRKKDGFEFTMHKDYILIADTKSKTNFHFYTDSLAWNSLSDVQFHNDMTRGWSGEYKAAKFNQQEIELLESFLKPAFETGWISKDIFISRKHWKSTVYFNNEMTGSPFIYYSSETGILSKLFFPLTSLIVKLFGTIKTVKVPPVGN